MPASPDPGKEGGANAVDQSAIVEAEDFFGVEGAIHSNVPLSEGDLMSETNDAQSVENDTDS